MKTYKEIGYTGRQTEEEIFGAAAIDKKQGKIFPLKNYMSYREAMEQVEGMQPYEDPSDPDPGFANDLHATIADKLKLGDYRDLNLYTAVGSHLDKWHGIDAVIKMKYDKRNYIIVTLDVTTNPQKGENYKADVVFLMPKEGLDPKIPEDKTRYREIIDSVSERVVEIVKDKIKEIKH